MFEIVCADISAALSLRSQMAAAAAATAAALGREQQRGREIEAFCFQCSFISFYAIICATLEMRCIENARANGRRKSSQFQRTTDSHLQFIRVLNRKFMQCNFRRTASAVHTQTCAILTRLSFCSARTHTPAVGAARRTPRRDRCIRLQRSFDLCVQSHIYDCAHRKCFVPREMPSLRYCCFALSLSLARAFPAFSRLRALLIESRTRMHRVQR